MTKCYGRYDRVAEGKSHCVESRPLWALDFGLIMSCVKNMAIWRPLRRCRAVHFTKPNIVIKPNANSRLIGNTTGYLANPRRRARWEVDGMNGR